MLDKKTIQVLLELLKEEENDREKIFSSFQQNLELINQRLDRIEAFLFKDVDTEKKSDAEKLSDFSSEIVTPEVLIPKSSHPSQEKFFSLKSLAEENHEICPLEPTPKPCDRCLMCSCRGF
ncbi:MAG: hypothetical protein D6687_06400 [Acidobacteria bacterium]|jgi:hypothetical protein|nr:MAG: hypothetical protein D6687_06400 [Acidobacteriota bacterium]GIU82577.1 MAG: hypothetical protein KatS3mg006_1641 [Pyrinomonadaceae bacterium]